MTDKKIKHKSPEAKRHHEFILYVENELQKAINNCMMRAEIDTGCTLVRILNKIR